MKRKNTNPECGNCSVRGSKPYKKPALRRLGALKSVAGSSIKF